ncbi:MAG: hypothetical protein OHK0017_08850 [Patescibacteria group bacterium]
MSANANFIQYKAEIIEILEHLTKGMVDKLLVSFEAEGEQWRIGLDSDDNRLLIGHQGENLLSLQHILRTIFRTRHPENRVHFILDVGGYRSSREKFVSNLVRDIAIKEVLEDGLTIIIKGLNSYERRLIHTSLEPYSGLNTSSIGNDENRRMVIRPSTGMNTVRIEEAKVIDIEKYKKEIREKSHSKHK